MAFIKINKQNFYHNLNQIALQTGSVDKIAIVLKDNAYGHGLELIAKLSSEYGVKHAVVRDITEARVVQNYFDTVLVLAGECANEEGFSFAINSLDHKISQRNKGRVKGRHRYAPQWCEHRRVATSTKRHKK